MFKGLEKKLQILRRIICRSSRESETLRVNRFISLKNKMLLFVIED